MTQWLTNLGDIFLATMLDVLPIAAILIGFQVFVLRRAIPDAGRVIAGFLLVLIGLAFFLMGLEQALFPLGKMMAQQLTDPAFLGIDVEQQDAIAEHWYEFYWVYIFAFAIGFSTAIAEPALIAVALKASQVSGGTINPWGLRIAVALGAATGISLGCYRIITGTPLHWYIIAAYVMVIAQTVFAPRSIIALAYDSGGVTTSTVTVPLVAALGLGLASSIPGRSPLLDGFGLIALTALFPIMTVMGYAQIGAILARRRRARGSQTTET